MTAPVFEHSEVGSCALSPRMAAFMENLDRRWKFEDALTAHAEVDSYVKTTIDEVGNGVAFLDEDALDPEAIKEALEPLIAFYEEAHTVAKGAAKQQADDEVKQARAAIENTARCYRLLRTLVDNLSDTAVMDRVTSAVDTLTPTDEEN